ncbi:DnaJ domain-containing protein [Sinomonas soli]
MRARDFYEVLGVDRTASRQEIRAAYRRLVRVLHPDGGGQDGTGQGRTGPGTGPDARSTLSDPDRERLKEVMDAYAVLGRDDRRAAYDAALARAETVLWAQPPPRRPVWLAPRTPMDEPLREEDLLWFLFRWFR